MKFLLFILLLTFSLIDNTGANILKSRKKNHLEKHQKKKYISLSEYRDRPKANHRKQLKKRKMRKNRKAAEAPAMPAMPSIPTPDGSCNGVPYMVGVKNNLKALKVPFKIPIKYGKKEENKPIIIVPQISFPRRKKQVIIHHKYSMRDYYQKMISQMNPIYMQMIEKNPYYSSLTNNHYYNQYLNKFKLDLMSEEIEQPHPLEGY